MNKKTMLLCSLVACAGISAGQAMAANCVPAKGKITNNAQADGSTLGVVALTLGAKKLKCALHGAPQPAVPGGPNYRHTLVCDDTAEGTAQAQLTFNTYFTGIVPTGSCPQGNPYNVQGPFSFAFTEVSFADTTTGRGAFSGTESGFLEVQGDFNCAGGITMKFSGEICLAE